VKGRPAEADARNTRSLREADDQRHKQAACAHNRSETRGFTALCSDLLFAVGIKSREVCGS